MVGGIVMIKWNKLALITASMGLLAACGNGDSEEDTTEDTEQVAEESNEELTLQPVQHNQLLHQQMI